MSEKPARPAKQPWLKFYPADWRGDVTLAPCSLAARGLWMEMLCIMSDAERRGSLITKDGEPYTTKRLAAVARATPKEVEKLLAELAAEGVFSRDEDGTIYSRRMRRDVEKAEADRANGGAGGNPNLSRKDKRGVNPSVNGTDKAQKLEARNQTPEAVDPSDQKDISRRLCADADLARFMKAHPRPGGEDAVRRQLTKTLAGGATIDQLCAAAEAYRKSEVGKDATYTKAAVGWLADGLWRSFLPKEPSEPRSPVVRVERESEAGQAWTSYLATIGQKPKWILDHRAGFFPTEWPPAQVDERGAA